MTFFQKIVTLTGLYITLNAGFSSPASFATSLDENCALCTQNNTPNVLSEKQTAQLTTLVSALGWSTHDYLSCADVIVRSHGQENIHLLKSGYVEFTLGLKMGRDGRLSNGNELSKLATQLVEQEKNVGTRKEYIQRAEKRFQNLTGYDFADLFFSTSLLVSEKGISLSVNQHKEVDQQIEGTMAATLAADKKDAIEAFNLFNRIKAKGGFNTSITLGADLTSPEIAQFKDEAVAKLVNQQTLKVLITPSTDQPGTAQYRSINIKEFLEQRLVKSTEEIFSKYGYEFYVNASKKKPNAPQLNSGVLKALDSPFCQNLPFLKKVADLSRKKIDFCQKHYPLFRKLNLNECKCTLALPTAEESTTNSKTIELEMIQLFGGRSQCYE